jgi:Domain of unknown function (DUF4386)
MTTAFPSTASSSTAPSTALRRVTGVLFIVSALTFTAAATLLSATFDWPDILREDADVVLPRFTAGGNALIWTWFATAWTYAILAIPLMLLPAVLGRRHDPVLAVFTSIGAASVLLSVVGFLRWVFVVPPLARDYDGAGPAARSAIEAAWLAQHQYGGALLGEHLGQTLAVAWSIAVSLLLLRTRALPRWLGLFGVVISVLYLSNQGDILSTAAPGFPVFDLLGLIGSTGWGLWIVALGVLLIVRAPRHGAEQLRS